MIPRPPRRVKDPDPETWDPVPPVTQGGDRDPSSYSYKGGEFWAFDTEYLWGKETHTGAPFHSG